MALPELHYVTVAVSAATLAVNPGYLVSAQEEIQFDSVPLNIF